MLDMFPLHLLKLMSFAIQQRCALEPRYHRWFLDDCDICEQTVQGELGWTHYFSTQGCRDGSTVCFGAGLLV